MLAYPTPASNAFHVMIERHGETDGGLHGFLARNGLFSLEISGTDGRIVAASAEAGVLFGREKLVGVPVHEVIASTDEVSFCLCLAAAFTGNTDRVLAEIAFMRDGCRFEASAVLFVRGTNIMVAVDFASLRAAKTVSNH